jgi:hypothetical protein
METPSRPDEMTKASNPDQLTGWKEIAAYLGKSVRTVQRWERQANLPVHRVQPLGEVVYAFRSELDRWRTTGGGASALDTATDFTDVPGVQEGSQPALPDTAPPDEPVGAVRATVGRRRRGVTAIGILVVVGAGVGLYFAIRPGSTFALRPQSPGPHIQGQSVQLTVVGFDPDHPVMRWTRLPNGREEPMRPALSADARGEIRWALSTDCQTETGTHHLWMQDEATGRRSQETAVVVLPNAECQKPLPDLAARVISLDKSSVKPGESITVQFSIWNMGSAAAVATKTRARLSVHSTRTAVSDTSLGDIPTDPLPVGQSTTQTATLTVPADTAPGVYYVWVVADNSGATIEPDSFNNFARSRAFAVVAK